MSDEPSFEEGLEALRRMLRGMGHPLEEVTETVDLGAFAYKEARARAISITQAGSNVRVRINALLAAAQMLADWSNVLVAHCQASAHIITEDSDEASHTLQ